MTRSARAVKMSVPRDERSPRLVRVTAAAWAADMGLGSADVDNWRIAVDELCTALVRIGHGERIEVELLATDGELLVTGRAAGSRAPWDGSEFDLARQILAVVAHTYALEERTGEIEFQLCHPRHTDDHPPGEPR